MPFVSLDPTTRIFYAIYAGQGVELDTSKPTVLLLHPRFFDHEVFATQYTDPQLRDNFNLVAIDIHYHGDTEAVIDDLPFDYARVVDDIFRVLDSLSITSCHVFGGSLGSAIALRMAVAQSQRILSLTLCATLPSVETAENLAQFRTVLEMAFQKDEGEEKGKLPRDMLLTARWLYFGKWSTPDLVRWEARSKFTQTNKPLILKIYSSLLDRKAIPDSDWTKISMPVLMIHGGADVQYPVDIGRQTYDLIPATTAKSFHVIEEGPHMIWWTHPEKVNKLFVDFMRSQIAL